MIFGEKQWKRVFYKPSQFYYKYIAPAVDKTMFVLQCSQLVALNQSRPARPKSSANTPYGVTQLAIHKQPFNLDLRMLKELRDLTPFLFKLGGKEGPATLVLIFIGQQGRKNWCNDICMH